MHTDKMKRIGFLIGSFKIMFNMPDKIEICKIRLHVFNRGTLKWIFMSFSIKYKLARLICKWMNLRVLTIKPGLGLYSTKIKWNMP